jgi:hypothetical protein
MAHSSPALNPRRGGNQFLAEYVILTFEVADLLAQHGVLVTRFQILSIERLGRRAHGIRQTLYDPVGSTLLVSSFQPIGRQSSHVQFLQ